MAPTTSPVHMADIARVTVDDLRRGHEDVIGLALAQQIATAIELALLTAVRGERRECVAECTRRAELWERTSDRADATELMRKEAQHRANEARFLADHIATRE